ncbi:MAG: heat-inducible transcriptional repressor HrcA [Chloroflexaceae bacterium]|jgi:heat-inducible transcriptional repressor|nr:heat-inducible transcriptional repressor HrcA [Chloroflexaceae bacterium]
MGAELTERRQHILKLIVQEFIETATPVASEVLVKKYGLSVSSATVRNEMGVLEDLGYLTHLHTSAGRVPTDAGYRFFVENLMDRTPLSSAEQRTIRHQFYQVRGELDQWIQLAGAVLARKAQNASLVTPPRADQLRCKNVELIAIHDTMALLVLVLHGGTIKQQTLTLETARSQEELRRISARLTERCTDSGAARLEEILAQMRVETPPPGELELQVLETVVRAMHQYEEQQQEQIYSDGLIEMLSQPEFIPALTREEDRERAVERVRRAMDILKSGRGLGPLIPQALASGGVQVVIGGEHSADELRQYSVILARYGIDGTVSGVLGVIGPTRMSYPRSISTVRYISLVMSDLLRDLYGVETHMSESDDTN